MESSSQTTGGPAYPVRFSVEYPDRRAQPSDHRVQVDRRDPDPDRRGQSGWLRRRLHGGRAGLENRRRDCGLLFLAPLLMILFRQKYPRWWFDWNRELLRFSNRIGVYVALMDDHYPSTDEQQAVTLDFPYPDAKQRPESMAAAGQVAARDPHYIVLVFLWFAAVVSVVIAWFAILFTGRYPRGLFDFVLGVFRWTNRVVGYSLILVTDEYPPFRLGP